MRSTEVSMLPEEDCHDLSEVDFGPARTAPGNFVTTGPSADFRKQVKKQLMAHPQLRARDAQCVAEANRRPTGPHHQ